MKRLTIISLLLGMFCFSSAHAGFLDAIGSGIDLIAGTLDLTQQTNDTINGFSDSDNSKNSSDEDEFPEGYKETCYMIHTMQKEYEQNELNAKDKWENKYITVTLKVINAIDTDDGYFIIGRTNTQAVIGYFSIGIPCSKNQAKKVTSGEYITASGRLTNIAEDCESADLKDARIIKL
jgi:hypothetical protein